MNTDKLLSEIKSELRELSCVIEAIPASVEQTQASIKAGECLDNIIALVKKHCEGEAGLMTDGCVAGCSHFTGGEIRHHKDCPKLKPEEEPKKGYCTVCAKELQRDCDDCIIGQPKPTGEAMTATELLPVIKLIAFIIRNGCASNGTHAEHMSAELAKLEGRK